jgi:hypothetical protein
MVLTEPDSGENPTIKLEKKPAHSNHFHRLSIVGSNLVVRN